MENTFQGTSDGDVGNDGNWSLGHIPTNGENAILDGALWSNAPNSGTISRADYCIFRNYPPVNGVSFQVPCLDDDSNGAFFDYCNFYADINVSGSVNMISCGAFSTAEFGEAYIIGSSFTGAVYGSCQFSNCVLNGSFASTGGSYVDAGTSIYGDVSITLDEDSIQSGNSIKKRLTFDGGVTWFKAGGGGGGGALGLGLGSGEL